MKKVCKILFIILIFNLIMIINSYATEDINSIVERTEKEIVNSEEYEQIELEEVTYINPLYNNVITEKDLNKPSNMMTASTSVDCRTIQEAGKELREEIKVRNETIQISYITNIQLGNTIFSQIVDEALKHTGVPTEGDYLLWQFAGWIAKGNINKNGNTYYYTLTYTFTYYTTYEQEKEMNIAVSNLLNTLDLKGTDYEKITIIYDYICNNIKYDYTIYDDKQRENLKYTAYGALIHKKSVCQGYAVLFYRLALENNIDARLISGLGNGGPHGWNIVKIRDYYYNVDATWDTNYVKREYMYYMLTDNNFSGHVRDSEYATSEFYKKYPMGRQNYTSAMNEFDKNMQNFTGIMLDNQTGYYSYYENGKINTKFSGLYEQDNEKWYVIQGRVNEKYKGIVKDTTGTYYIENGKVAKNTTTVMQIDNAWKIIVNGVLDNNYTGIGSNSSGTWYLENGVVNFKYNGTYIQGDQAKIIEGGKVVATVAKNITTVMQINNIWRYVENGKVSYNYTGLGINDLGTWLIKDGTIKFDYTGNYVDKDGKTYIIEKNKVLTNISKVIQINNVWRMVVNGIIDYSYTGLGTNEYGTWYLENGNLNLGYKATYIEGENAHIIEGGKVVVTISKNTTTVMKINNIWRYVENGRVNYNYIGIGTNDLGTWYLKDGKVSFDYTGNYTDKDGKTYIIEKSQVMTKLSKVMQVNNVWKMVVNGVVDNNYTGLGINEYGTWYLENGNLDLEYKGTYIQGNNANIIEAGKVIVTLPKTTTTVMQINNIWRYVANGVVDYNYTGLGNNNLGTWLVKEGTIKFDYTGNYTDKDGKIYKIEKNKVIK